METSIISHSLIIFISLEVTISSLGHVHSNSHNDFLRCIQNNSSTIVYTPNNSSYLPILQSSIMNLRFTSQSTPKPSTIVTPVLESQIPTIVSCAKQNKMQIRTRSGGHDYEGLSYTSQVPFLVVDLINLGEIKIDVDEKTAWVQSGATIGQLYYEISRKSQTLAFPSGTCPTVGVGGHFSGGGYGTLLRKYGLAADNIIDARLVDVHGNIHDRESMGEELFWAIRGGGGASFGIITAWKLNLVSVPKVVTIFNINRTLAQNATELVYKWQFIAPRLPNDLFISLAITKVNNPSGGNVFVTFNSLFLGGADRLLELLKIRFPELGVVREDCNEVSWIQSALFFGGYPIGVSPRVLSSRVPLTRLYFKAKSDYVREPVPEHGFQGVWELLNESGANVTLMIFVPYGGRMEEISESSIPFPHRAGNLYKIQHLVSWDRAGMDASRNNINWIRRLYGYMAPFVSKFPRAAYVNFRDLDLGTNNDVGNTSYERASVWGFKYFKNNFERLVKVKTEVDASNFFRNEQSIPPYGH